MNIPTIEMPTEEAQAKYDEFRDVLMKNATNEERILKRGYRALAKGKKIIDLDDVMKNAGQDDNGFPKLAISRADGEFVYFQQRTDGGGVFSITTNFYGRDYSTRIVMPDGTFPQKVVYPTFTHTRWANYLRAVVPVIPNAIRPRFSIQNYHILFEPVWEYVPHPDPILLKRLSGSLFVVLAAWDLTELEQKVLKGRL
jgi:hypothetical protein